LGEIVYLGEETQWAPKSDHFACSFRLTRPYSRTATMSGSSPPPPDSLYHSVPQSDVAPMVSDIELDGDDEVFDQPLVTASNNPVDTRIRWINFMFGCAVLLPWNGASFILYKLELIH
jgi:hypothetical protein